MAMAVVYTTFAGQIVSENRGGVTREYLSDPLGSTIALASSTAITDTWDYWPYGEVMTRTGTNPTPFTFVGTLGYFKDLLDRLFYVRARHYQPNYGRWMTVDPLWPEEPSFSYAEADSIARSDPSGLMCVTRFRACGMSYNKRCRRFCRMDQDIIGVCIIINIWCWVICGTVTAEVYICVCYKDLVHGYCWAICKAACLLMPLPIRWLCEMQCNQSCKAIFPVIPPVLFR